MKAQTTPRESISCPCCGKSTDKQVAAAIGEFALYAAAPDLLEACQQVLKDFGDRLTGKTVLMLRSAISKAEGR